MVNEPEDAEAVEFLFEAVKDAPDRAMAQIKSLETRGAQAFTAATILIGLASVGPLREASRWTVAFFALAVAAYVVVAGIALWLLRPGFVFGLPSADTMWRDYRNFNPGASKAVIMEALARDAPKNADLIGAKERWARAAVIATAAEGVAMGVALLLSRAIS